MDQLDLAKIWPPDHPRTAEAAKNDRKKRLACRYIGPHMPALRMNCEPVLAGGMAAMREYEVLAGPVPAKE